MFAHGSGSSTAPAHHQSRHHSQWSLPCHSRVNRVHAWHCSGQEGTHDIGVHVCRRQAVSHRQILILESNELVPEDVLIVGLQIVGFMVHRVVDLGAFAHHTGVLLLAGVDLWDSALWVAGIICTVFGVGMTLEPWQPWQPWQPCPTWPAWPAWQPCQTRETTWATLHALPNRIPHRSTRASWDSSSLPWNAWKNGVPRAIRNFTEISDPVVRSPPALVALALGLRRESIAAALGSRVLSAHVKSRMCWARRVRSGWSRQTRSPGNTHTARRRILCLSLL